MKSWFKGFSQKTSEYLGFPEPLLGPITWRVPVLAKGEGWIALFKPPGCLVGPDSRLPEHPSMAEAWEEQLAMGKPELLATGLRGLKPVYWLDPEIHGPALLVEPGPALETLRNDYGSEKFHFRFEFLATDGGRLENEFEVDLPIQINEETEVRVTHRFGKKCLTRFKRLQQWGRMSLWEARTQYPRPFQVRTHAWESRLRMVGEKRVGNVGELYLSNLKSHYSTREEERPLWPGLAMRLAEVSWEGTEIVCPPVGPWTATLKKLDQYGYSRKR